MNLKTIVDKALKSERRTFDWLCTELEMTPQGLRGALTNENLKFKDLKKLVSLLNISIDRLFENYISQHIEGDNNNQISQVGEATVMYRTENDRLNELVIELRNQIKDKEEIIQLLKKQNK